MSASTSLTELVETANIAKALKRLRRVHGWSSPAVGRALVHALAISGVGNNEQQTAVRQAFHLP